jgi:hypothetical protein
VYQRAAEADRHRQRAEDERNAACDHAEELRAPLEAARAQHRSSQQREQAAARAVLKAARREENERNAAVKRERQRRLALPVHERLAAARRPA